MKPMFRILLAPALVLFVFHAAHAQNPDIKRTYHWYFGNKAGLDFSSGTPVAITNSAMTAEEGCASISDTCGELLFYTDGDTVWDKNNNVMPNGIGLMGCWSSTQSSLIVPQPGNDSLYYIFLTDCGENLGANGLRYSIVNIKLNGGLGDVTAKNVLLHAPAMEKLSGTYHANGNDIWILSVNRYPPGPPPDTTYQYYAYLLKSTGVDTVPVISSSKIHPHKLEDDYLRFSHSGNKITNAWHDVEDTTEIMDFNNSNGVLSNSMQIIPDSINYFNYGIIFSPDDSKLYLSVYNFLSNSFPNWNSKVFQYDLSSGDSAIIVSTKTLIQSSDSSSYLLPFFMAMQAGSDEKVYIAKLNNYPPYYPDTIDVIANPNAAGLACNYVANGVFISGGSQAGLPNFVDSYFRGSWQPPCTTEGIEESDLSDGNILVYPNPFSDYTIIRITNLSELRMEKIQLRIFDLLGKEVAPYVIRNADGFIFNRGNLSSGIYFLKIQTQNKFYTQKLIITN